MIRLYTFFIVVAIVAVLSHIFFVMPRAEYTSETKLLIVPQSEAVLSYVDIFLNDISVIAQTAITHSDEVGGVSTRVAVDRIPGHSVITLAIESSSPKESVAIERKALQDIVTRLSDFYTIDKDFTIEILARDDVARKKIIPLIAPYVLSVAIVLGVVSGILALLHLLQIGQRDAIFKKDRALDGKNIFEKYHSASAQDVQEDVELHQEVDFVKDEEVNTMESDNEKKKKNVSQDQNITTQPKKKKKKIVKEEAKESSAPGSLPTTPGNLPIVDLGNAGFAPGEEGDGEVEDGDREPTEEELKARLNELLNGKL